MAGGSIKGITIEFSGNTTKLDKALRQIRNSTKDIDKELKSVDKALKFNPASVDLWRQKQDLLKAKIKETENNLKELKNIQAQMDAKGVDKNSEEYRRLQREIIETESKLKHFNSEYKKIGQVNLRAASEQFKKMGKNLESAGRAMSGLSRVAAAVAASIGAVTVKSAKWADDLNTMSKIYNIGTKDLQKYGAAAQLVDVDVNTIAKSHQKLTKQMASAQKGTGKSAEAFEELGINIVNADGSLRDGDAVWQETIAALGQMENETERDAMAMQLMGKSASELNPLIEDGGETYKNFAETLDKYGLEFIDQETLDNANAFKDSLDSIKAIGLVAFQQLGTQLAGYLAPAMERLVDVVGRLANWFSQLSPRTQAIIAAIAGIVAVAAPLLIGLGKISFAISSILSLMATLGPAIAGIVATFGPVILIIGAVVAAGVLLYKNWDVIKKKATELWNSIKKTFNGIKTTITTIWNNIKTAVSNAVNSIKTKVLNTFKSIKTSVTSTWNSIKTAITKPIQTALNSVRTAINKIKSIINGAHLSLPRFKLPHFKIYGGTLPWGIGGKGTAPRISVSWYKEGGIFDQPSLIGLAEAGAEAVVPLDTLWQKLDNIASASSGSQTIINIYASPGMDVNELAKAVERRLAVVQKQRQLVWQ